MKISEQIIEVLEYLGEKFGIAIDWSSETVLPVIQTLCGKYIRWEIATSIVWAVIGVILLIIGFIALPKAIAALERYREDYDEDWRLYVSIIVTIFCLLFGFIAVSTQVFDIIKCYAFPELQVFEYIQGLITSNTAN